MGAAALDFMSWAEGDMDMYKPVTEEEKQHLCTITLTQLKKAVYQFEKAEKAQKI